MGLQREGYVYYMLMQPGIWISKSYHKPCESYWLSVGVQAAFQMVFFFKFHHTENFLCRLQGYPFSSPIISSLQASVSFPSRVPVFIHILATQPSLPP